MAGSNNAVMMSRVLPQRDTTVRRVRLNAPNKLVRSLRSKTRLVKDGKGIMNVEWKYFRVEFWE